MTGTEPHRKTIFGGLFARVHVPGSVTFAPADADPF
jgi:hypothetical protein